MGSFKKERERLGEEELSKIQCVCMCVWGLMWSERDEGLEDNSRNSGLGTDD